MNRVFGLLVASTLLLSGCSSVSTEEARLPLPPKWIQPSDAHVIGAAKVVAEIRALLPNVAVYHSDDAYIRVSYHWLEQLIPWTLKAQTALRFTYRPNSRDCDKMALAFFLACTSSAASAGVDATPLVARIVVEQTNDFGAVPGSKGMRHALIGVCTDRGLYVLEPQPNFVGALRLVPLAQYPNRIRAVILGDPNPY